MKLNENIKIVGSKVVLVPYEEEHVSRYHSWMKDEKLQELTASEPLSLEQEYQMQQLWRSDENKCTFIVLDRGKYNKDDPHNVGAMIGDVNLFLCEERDDKMAEIEVMIADENARGKGFGQQALCLMLTYGIQHLKLHKFMAKISVTNSPSLGLFRKLGFMEVSRCHVFNEVTLEYDATNDNQVKLSSFADVYETQDITR